MLQDRYGNTVSTSSNAALAHYDEALLLMRLYEGDPITALDDAITQDPGFTAAWAARAAILILQADRAYLPEAERSIAEGLARGGTEQERAQLAACRDWASGRTIKGVEAFTAIAQQNPRDLVSLQSSHVGNFYLGNSTGLRDEPLRALKATHHQGEGYHAIAGMAAFGLEECGEYDRALELGEEAASLEDRDAWAVHAVAHVHEMRGDTDRGIAWLRRNRKALAPGNGFSYHNWWHLALFHLDQDDHAAALSLYDSHVRPDPEANVVLEWIDASALLWRLHLDDVDTGDRFGQLADCWARAIDDRHYAFNDVHAIMAFLGAGQWERVDRCLASLRVAAQVNDDNGHVARTVGLPLAEAFLAYEQGRYADATRDILAVRPFAHGFGGSHAQRDILSLTALHGARKGNLRAEEVALATERHHQKPNSPWAKRLAAKAGVM